MDVEGTELDVLKGAADTIKKYRPKLAISIYHRPYRQLIDIPLFIMSLNLGYKFYMGHHDILEGEIVLYAIAESEKEL
jgi:hypothetical protein